MWFICVFPKKDSNGRSYACREEVLADSKEQSKENIKEDNPEVDEFEINVREASEEEVHRIESEF